METYDTTTVTDGTRRASEHESRIPADLPRMRRRSREADQANAGGGKTARLREQRVRGPCGRRALALVRGDGGRAGMA